MKFQKQGVLNSLLVCVFFASSSLVYASNAQSLVDDGFEGRFLQSRAQEITLPETCKSPYRDAPNFIEFYTTSAYVLAAKQGAQSGALTDLFAVAALRERMRELFPSLGEESPIDRLIVAQLCNYEAIKIQKDSRPGQRRLIVSPMDEDLHEHLLTIAPRLYTDARKIMVEALAFRARERKQNLDLERQWHQVEKARRSANSKIKDLFKE